MSDQFTGEGPIILLYVWLSSLCLDHQLVQAIRFQRFTGLAPEGVISSFYPGHSTLIIRKDLLRSGLPIGSILFRKRMIAR